MRLSPLLIAALFSLPAGTPWSEAHGQSGPAAATAVTAGGPLVADVRVAVWSVGDAATPGHPPFLVASSPMPTSSAGRPPSFWRHTGVGFLVGTAAGLTVGLALDTEGSCGMTYCTLLAAPAGAVTGTVAGMLVWAVRRLN